MDGNRNFGRKGGYLKATKHAGPYLVPLARGLRCEADEYGGWRGWDELFARLYVEMGIDQAQWHADWGA